MRAALGGLAAAAMLAACGGGSDTVSAQAAADPTQAQVLSARRPATNTPGTSTTSAAAVAQPPNTEGRLLASNCFQCHGTLGTGGFDSIRGGEAKEVLEYAGKIANRDIMAAHAQGYTPEQLRKIVSYLQQ